jgi:hypothetical protein
MITEYDLTSFTVIDADDATIPRAMPASLPAMALRLQTVTESELARAAPQADYSMVIAVQVLAGLSE